MLEIKYILCLAVFTILLLINGYSENYGIRILYLKAKDVKYSNHGISAINKTIWTNWIKDNRLSTILNSNGNFNEKEIQELYAASRHNKAGALNQNLSVEILKILGIMVQEKIERNQNPMNCGKKKKLVVELMLYGYGSNMDMLAMALHEALYAGRTLILSHNKTWRYSKEGWEKVHSPLSKSCTTFDPKESSGIFFKESGKQIMYLLHLSDLTRVTNVPAGIPKDMAALLVAVHSRPTLWWYAQFIKYVSRLQPWIKDRVDNTRKELVNQGLVAPYVGVHVRRGDIINKVAQFYSVEKYMNSVEKYFQTLAVKNSSQASGNISHEYKGRVYLATDDDQVFAEMKEQYPEYQIFVYTSKHHKRYGEDNLIEIIMDLAFLSEADFNVCTMSSNICRRTLDFKETELWDSDTKSRLSRSGNILSTHGYVKVAHHVDMTSSIHSIDMQYRFDVLSDFRIATEDNTRHNGTIAMEKGDIIKRLKWKWQIDCVQDMGNGYNERTKKRGVYPISKTKHYIKVADFPIYMNKNRSRAENIVQMLTKELFQRKRN